MRPLSSLLLFYESVCWALTGFIAAVIVSLWSSAAPVVMGPHYHGPRFTRMPDERSAEHGVAAVPWLLDRWLQKSQLEAVFFNNISAWRISKHLLQVGSTGERPHLLMSNLEGLKTSEWPSSPPKVSSGTGLTSVIRSINISKTPPRPCTLKDHTSCTLKSTPPLLQLY